MSKKNGIKHAKRNGRIEASVTPSGGNVFADLGVAEPERHLAKARLAVEVVRQIEALGLTQAEAAKRLGVDQPKVSALVRGRLGGFSTDRLLRFLVALGRGVDIVVRPASGAGRPAVMRVLAEA